MPEYEPARYRPGAPIDTTRPLEIVGLTPHRWEPIEKAYPEVKAAGPKASFRNQPNTTIYPPSEVSPKVLQIVAIERRGDRVYPLYDKNDRLVGVLIHQAGTYSVLIYRLRPKRRK